MDRHAALTMTGDMVTLPERSRGAQKQEAVISTSLDDRFIYRDVNICFSYH